VAKATEVKHSIIKWIRVDGEEGYKANFDVACNQCGTKMFLRNSELTFINKSWYGQIQVEPVLKVMYKCIPCAVVSWFWIGYPYMDVDYWNELLKRRDNHFLYIPPPETWSDDAKVQKRLQALGYLGGDIDYSEKTELEEK